VQKRQITTVFFDVGNTLTYVDLEVTLHPLAKRGLHPSEDQLRFAEIEARQTMDRLRAAGTHPNPDAEYWRIFLQCLLGSLGIEDDAIQAEVSFEWRSARNWTKVAEGTTEALDRLASRYELGVISNADGTIARLLKTVGLAGYFRSIIDSGTVGHQKPSPEIFRLALESMGAEPDESVYVGDIYSVDYLGATGVGMKAVLIDGLGVYAHLDVPRVSRLGELEALLEKL
jgi:HAD superfamily hydrolase (TIGR01549 family)